MAERARECTTDRLYLSIQRKFTHKEELFIRSFQCRRCSEYPQGDRQVKAYLLFCGLRCKIDGDSSGRKSITSVVYCGLHAVLAFPYGLFRSPTMENLGRPRFATSTSTSTRYASIPRRAPLSTLQSLSIVFYHDTIQGTKLYRTADQMTKLLQESARNRTHCECYRL